MQYFKHLPLGKTFRSRPDVIRFVVHNIITGKSYGTELITGKRQVKVFVDSHRSIYIIFNIQRKITCIFSTLK